MYRWLSIFLLTVCAGAHAGPPASEEDDLDRFMEDKGLLTQLEQVGQNVTNRASDLVVTAMGFLGVPYRRGGNSAATGFDCSGFVRAIYEQTVGLILPRRANEQAAATQTIDKQDLQPGDLVFFNTMKRAFSHVGIYVGDGKFIHSPKPGAQVRVEDMGKNYWNRRFDGARRVLSLSSAADPQPVQP
jgi:cell wall-associated NlpC family hydrolase